MKNWIKATLLALCMVAVIAPAAVYETVEYPLVANWDVEGFAASQTRLVAQVNLTNTTFTIANALEVCRPISVIVTDTGPSITVGTLTITGTDCDGDALVVAQDWSGGAATQQTTENFETVTSYVADSFATLDGGGDELIEIGVVALTDASYVYCRMEPIKPRRLMITTSGDSATTVGVTAADDPFQNLAVGDWIGVNLPFDPDVAARGVTWRHITAIASVDSLTVNDAWELTQTTGQTFFYRKRNCGAGDHDGWIGMAGTESITFDIDMVQLVATGGISYQVECENNVPGMPPIIVSGPTNVATGTPTQATVAVTTARAACRLGLRIITGDDGNDLTTNTEIVYTGAIVRR